MKNFHKILKGFYLRKYFTNLIKEMKYFEISLFLGRFYALSLQVLYIYEAYSVQAMPLFQCNMMQDQSLDSFFLRTLPTIDHLSNKSPVKIKYSNYKSEPTFFRCESCEYFYNKIRIVCSIAYDTKTLNCLPLLPFMPETKMTSL